MPRRRCNNVNTTARLGARPKKEDLMPNNDYMARAFVKGMTCGHCVSHVTEELESLDAVQTVSVLLEKEGTSTVTITANSEITEEKIREAIDEAGNYEVVGIEFE